MDGRRDRRENERLPELLRALARSAPAPPQISWGRFRAELDEKLGQPRGPASPLRDPELLEEFDVISHLEPLTGERGGRE